MKTLLLALLCSLSLLMNVSDGQILSPRVGYVRDSGGSVRPVYGIEGNYVIGTSGLGKIDSASFSDAGGFLQTPGSLALAGLGLEPIATIQTSHAASVIRMHGALDTAIAYVPDSKSLIHWDGVSFVTVDIPELSVSQTIRAVRKMNANAASLLGLTPDGAAVRSTFSLNTGRMVDSTIMPGKWESVFEDGERVLGFAGQSLTVLSLSGEAIRVLALASGGDLAFEQASTHCLHLSSEAAGRDWLLHSSRNDYRLYQLPRPRPAQSAAQSTTTGAAR